MLLLYHSAAFRASLGSTPQVISAAATSALLYPVVAAVPSPIERGQQACHDSCTPPDHRLDDLALFVMFQIGNVLGKKRGFGASQIPYNFPKVKRLPYTHNGSD
jgi:hypothetical protein